MYYRVDRIEYRGAEPISQYFTEYSEAHDLFQSHVEAGKECALSVIAGKRWDE